MQIETIFKIPIEIPSFCITGYDRETKEIFFVKVAKRDAPTLRQVLSDNILPETTVITDCWKAYKLDGLDFAEHLKINHSINFVDPHEINIHTQGIESQWSKAKRDLRKRLGVVGLPNNQDFIIEWIWRSGMSSVDELFDDFCEAQRYF